MSQPGRIAALSLFVAGLLALSGALWLRHAVSQVEVTSVQLSPALQDGRASLVCVVRGRNPLPVDVQVRHLRLVVGEDVLASGVELRSDAPIKVEAGAFIAQTRFDADSASLGVMAGQGLSILFGRALNYRIEMRVGWGPLERTMTFSGALGGP